MYPASVLVASYNASRSVSLAAIFQHKRRAGKAKLVTNTINTYDVITLLCFLFCSSLPSGRFTGGTPILSAVWAVYWWHTNTLCSLGGSLVAHQCSFITISHNTCHMSKMGAHPVTVTTCSLRARPIYTDWIYNISQGVAR